MKLQLDKIARQTWLAVILLTGCASPWHHKRMYSGHPLLGSQYALLRDGGGALVASIDGRTKTPSGEKVSYDIGHATWELLPGTHTLQVFLAAQVGNYSLSSNTLKAVRFDAKAGYVYCLATQLTWAPNGTPADWNVTVKTEGRWEDLGRP
jgi:hypothetical protein